MAPRVTQFKCLHCGHEYAGTYDPKNIAERTCPQCRSNSIMRLSSSKPVEKK